MPNRSLSLFFPDNRSRLVAWSVGVCSSHIEPTPSLPKPQLRPSQHIGDSTDAIAALLLRNTARELACIPSMHKLHASLSGVSDTRAS